MAPKKRVQVSDAIIETTPLRVSPVKPTVPLAAPKPRAKRVSKRAGIQSTGIQSAPGQTVTGSDLIQDTLTQSTALTVNTGLTTTTESSIITDKYQKLSDIDHVLTRPDMWAGNTTLDEGELYVIEDELMVRRPVQFIPALFKIFDEGLVNMRDHVERMSVNQMKQDRLKLGMPIDDRTITVNDVFRQVKQLSVEIDPSQNKIVMTNDGNGIDVVMHPEHGVYVPEMIFFHPKSGTNYDDNVKRTWGGRNGIGSKLIAIFSSECTIETVDHIRKLKYVQTCSNNMRQIDPPVITTCRNLPYTRISFKPDLRIFNLPSLDSYDMVPLFHKRVYDIAACTNKGVNVLLNGGKVPVRDFEKYVDLYLGTKKEAKRVKLQPNEYWEVYVGLNTSGKFEQVSFVNGVCTAHGGKHVDHVATKIVNKLVEEITNTKKQLKDLKPQMVKNLLTVFVNATIVNPGFNNQMKDCLTTPSKDFGSEFSLGPEEVKSLLKLGLVEACIQALTEKNQKKLEGMGGRKARIKDEKSVVAKYAGTAKAKDCILILTEGDSAKTLAMSGLDALEEEDRNYIGVMPLKGKVINVKTNPTDKIISNDEYKRIINMMGLKPGQRDYSRMNYGHIAVLTDADHDGYHIKGLLFNMFHKYWPELLKREKFFLSIRTPIVGITQKRTKAKQYLYSYVEFNEWQSANSEHLKEYEFDYYKGLGRHTAMEAREIFKNLEYVDYVWKNDLSYKWIDFFPGEPNSAPPVSGDDEISEEGGHAIPHNPLAQIQVIGGASAAATANEATPHTNASDASNNFRKLRAVESCFQPVQRGLPEPDYCDASLKLAFEDQMADHRKDWIIKYLVKRANGQVNYDFQKSKSINYFDFINSELIEFSVEDNLRSIPNIMDGFKPSQRKILYCCLRRRTPFKKIRVDQLAGNISENTNYHHGNESLNGAIILMAQDYVGSNNLNLLVPEGQFGTRIQNGKDHAAPRYLCTFLNPIVSQIFDKRDGPLLKRIYDEGQLWEPEYYLPTLPLVLINGARGIGTGFATDVPSYNPIEIIANIDRFLKREPLVTMKPYYHGFQGTIEQVGSHSYKVTGKYERDDLNDTVTITEIPVGAKMICSFESYKNYLEGLVEKYPAMIRDVDCQYVDVSLKATVLFQPSCLAQLDQVRLEKLLKLSSSISTANMNLYNPQLVLRHYDTAEEILVDFMEHRLYCYEQRRLFMLNGLKRECELLNEKARFIGYEIDDANPFTVRKLNKVKAIALLKEHHFKTTEEINQMFKQEGLGQTHPEVEGEGDEGEGATPEGGAAEGGAAAKADGYGGYGYLVKMPIVNQTLEMIEKLQTDRSKKLEEIAALEATTAQTLYVTDLAEVREKYLQHIDEWSQRAYASLDRSSSGSGTRKRVTRRSRAKALQV